LAIDVSIKGTSSGSGDLRIVKEVDRQLLLLPRIQDGCGLLDLFDDFPSTINNIMPAQEGVAAAAAARHRHGLVVEDEGFLKDFVVNFIFLVVLCIVIYIF
jgi:hypothetical protein